jgi:hypothetical protein
MNHLPNDYKVFAAPVGLEFGTSLRTSMLMTRASKVMSAVTWRTNVAACATRCLNDIRGEVGDEEERRRTT